MKRPDEPEAPRLSEEGRWYNEHAALVVTTLKWAVLGAAAGVCVGWGTRAFLWSLTASSALVARIFPGWFRPYFLLSLALPVCVCSAPGVAAAFGFVSVLAGAANTPIAAAVMGMEMLPHDLGVYAALCAGTAFLMVGHRSVYASQKLGLAKSGGLEVPFDVPVGEISPAEMRIRKGSLTESVLEELEKVEKGVRHAGRRQRRPR